MATENSTLSKVFGSGMLCDLHVSYYTALKKLKPIDLGLNPDDLPDNLYSLGRRRLLPKEVISGFKCIETRARRILTPPLGHTFPATSSAKFVPMAHITRVDEELTVMKNTFLSALENFQDAYPEARSQMMRQWEAHLWQIATKVKPEGERTKWVEDTLATLDTMYPTEDSIPGAFQFRWDWYSIQFPSGESVGENLTAEQVKARVAAMDKYRRYAEEQIKRFLEGVVASQRAAAIEICEKWAEQVASGKKIHHMRLAELKNFVAQFRDGNFLRDHVVAAELDKLERIVPDSIQELGDDGESASRINAALTRVKAAASDINYSSKAVVASFLGAGRAIGKD